MEQTVNRIRRRKKKKSLLPFLLTVAILGCIFRLPDISRKFVYPEEYQMFVERFSSKYGVDKNLIFAVIKTESNFDPNARSDVGARGLMQLMEDTYEWVGYRMEDDRELTYDNMYDPEYNIEYGTYLLRLLYDEYGDNATVLAAYHTGRGNVNKWLTDKNLSSDGCTLDSIPSAATEHYVSKVMKAYDAYNNLY